MEDRNTFHHLCSLGKQVPWIAVLALMLIYVAFKDFEFSCILVISTLVIISSLIFTFLKKIPDVVEKQQTVNSVQESSSFIEDASLQVEPESEISPYKEAQHEEKTISERMIENKVWENYIHEYSFRSSDSLLSESEGIAMTSTSEDSELGGSDSSISDEDKFIEIALPSGYRQNACHHKEESKFHQQQNKCLDMFPRVSTLKQQFILMDLLAEINDMKEEENFIEIDISMGSIKFPRFEIEA